MGRVPEDLEPVCRNCTNRMMTIDGSAALGDDGWGLIGLTASLRLQGSRKAKA